MDFKKSYKRVLEKGEVNNGISHVERAGYVSAQKRIENLILAGKRLKDVIDTQYDFPDGKVDEDFIDPTRTKGYDMADAFNDAENLKMRMRTIKESSPAGEDSKRDVVVDAGKLDEGPEKG